MDLNRVVKLTDFGGATGVLQYANEKSSIRYFVKKFNLAFNLPENNNTGTVRELMKYGSTNTRKQFKDWYKAQLEELLQGEETEVVRETYVVEAPVTPRATTTTTPSAITRSVTVEETEEHPTEFDETEVDSFMEGFMNGEV